MTRVLKRHANDVVLTKFDPMMKIGTCPAVETRLGITMCTDGSGTWRNCTPLHDDENSSPSLLTSRLTRPGECAGAVHRSSVVESQVARTTCRPKRQTSSTERWKPEPRTLTTVPPRVPGPSTGQIEEITGRCCCREGQKGRGVRMAGSRCAGHHSKICSYLKNV